VVSVLLVCPLLDSQARLNLLILVVTAEIGNHGDIGDLTGEEVVT